MRAKFGRGPMVVSKKGSLKFISRLLEKGQNGKVCDAMNVFSATPFFCPIQHVLDLFHKMYPETFDTLPYQ